MTIYVSIVKNVTLEYEYANGFICFILYYSYTTAIILIYVFETN